MNKVIIKNPNTLFNNFKRTISFIVGSSLLFILYKAFEQDLNIDSFGKLSTIIIALGLSGVFIYYSIFRPSIHKLCFIQFDNDKLFGRIPAPMDSYDYDRTLMLRLMVAPQFEEFEFKYSEIDDIIIEMNKIIILAQGKGEQKIYLSNLDYMKLKEIKNRFEILRNKIKNAL